MPFDDIWITVSPSCHSIQDWSALLLPRADGNDNWGPFTYKLLFFTLHCTEPFIGLYTYKPTVPWVPCLRPILMGTRWWALRSSTTSSLKGNRQDLQHQLKGYSQNESPVQPIFTNIVKRIWFGDRFINMKAKTTCKRVSWGWLKAWWVVEVRPLEADFIHLLNRQGFWWISLESYRWVPQWGILIHSRWEPDLPKKCQCVTNKCQCYLGAWRLCWYIWIGMYIISSSL